VPLIVSFTRAARDSAQSNGWALCPPKMLDTPALVLDVCVTSLFPFWFLVALTAKEASETLMVLMSRVQNFGAGGGSWCVVIAAEQNVVTGWEMSADCTTFGADLISLNAFSVVWTQSLIACLFHVWWWWWWWLWYMYVTNCLPASLGLPYFFYIHVLF